MTFLKQSMIVFVCLDFFFLTSGIGEFAVEILGYVSSDVSLFTFRKSKLALTLKLDERGENVAPESSDTILTSPSNDFH